MTDISLQSGFDDSGSHTILVADDLADNVMILKTFLHHHNYRTVTASNGQETLDALKEHSPHLILVDLNMPDMSGLEVIKKIRKDEAYDNVGIILLTASCNLEQLLKSFKAGADDYIQKPYHHIEMLARVQSVLKKHESNLKLIEVNKRLDEFNQDLEETVAKQVDELEKVNRLRRYFSPQVAEKFLNEEAAPFSNKRTEITVVFLDLRGFTHFAEQNDADVIMSTLSEFHSSVGPVIFQFNATLERFTGDGLMCFIGAPHAEEKHADKAVDMAKAMQEEVSKLVGGWQKKGYGLGLGIGISTGMASTGTIGFEKRLDYAAIGSVTNLSSRLCAMAEAGEVLVSEYTANNLKDKSQLVSKGKKSLKGFTDDVKVFSLKSQ
ncbi:MAG: response regulator [Lentisphaeraceae bacterium]|nr:response regulator [Lentisphaeraceae bacterium]